MLNILKRKWYAALQLAPFRLQSLNMIGFINFFIFFIRYIVFFLYIIIKIIFEILIRFLTFIYLIRLLFLFGKWGSRFTSLFWFMFFNFIFYVVVTYCWDIFLLRSLWKLMWFWGLMLVVNVLFSTQVYEIFKFGWRKSRKKNISLLAAIKLNGYKWWEVGLIILWCIFLNCVVICICGYIFFVL